jgi:salicylate hydroxylase
MSMSYSTHEKQFTVCIIGGGIGGLMLALGLIRRNVPVQIYEAAASFREIGLGLTIGPAALRAMHLIDPRIFELHESLVTTHADSPGYESFKQTWLEVVWANGDNVGQVLLELKAPPSGQTSVRRSDFLEALINLVPKEMVHFHKRLVSLHETPDGVLLTFQEGTSAMADVVVGCDGIKSKVKEFMLPDEFEETKPRYSGMYGYRAIVDMEAMVQAVGDRRARIATWHIGKGAYAVTYPIMGAKKVNVGLYTMSDGWDSDIWVRPATKSDMERDFGHLGDSVNAVIKVSSPESDSHRIY